MTTTNTYYSYDRSHRMTSQYILGGESHYYTHNERNMVASIQDVGGSDTFIRSFVYNGVGERVIVTDNSSFPGLPAYWSYDGRKLLQDKQAANTTGAVAPTNYRHNFSLQDRVLGSGTEIGVAEANQPSYPVYDGASNATNVQSPGLGASDNFVANFNMEQLVGTNSLGTRTRAMTGTCAVHGQMAQEVYYLPFGMMLIPSTSVLLGGTPGVATYPLDRVNRLLSLWLRLQQSAAPQQQAPDPPIYEPPPVPPIDPTDSEDPTEIYGHDDLIPSCAPQTVSVSLNRSDGPTNLSTGYSFSVNVSITGMYLTRCQLESYIRISDIKTSASNRTQALRDMFTNWRRYRDATPFWLWGKEDPPAFAQLGLPIQVAPVWAPERVRPPVINTDTLQKFASISEIDFEYTKQHPNIIVNNGGLNVKTIPDFLSVAVEHEIRIYDKPSGDLMRLHSWGYDWANYFTSGSDFGDMSYSAFVAKLGRSPDFGPSPTFFNMHGISGLTWLNP